MLGWEGGWYTSHQPKNLACMAPLMDVLEYPVVLSFKNPSHPSMVRLPPTRWLSVGLKTTCLGVWQHGRGGPYLKKRYTQFVGVSQILPYRERWMEVPPKIPWPHLRSKRNVRNVPTRDGITLINWFIHMNPTIWSKKTFTRYIPQILQENFVTQNPSNPVGLSPWSHISTVPDGDSRGEHLLGVEPIDLQWHAPGEAGACKVVFRNGEGLGHWGWDSGLERGCFLVMLHDTKMLPCSVPILVTFDSIKFYR